jgi:hypothetical protein
VEGGLDFVVRYFLDAIVRAPHLYAFTAVYWLLVGGVVVTRYVLRRQRASQILMAAVLATGVAAVVLAFVDVALRGQQLIQISLVAYFATPIGLGRYWIRRMDRTSKSAASDTALRILTYVTAFALFLALSAASGDPWTVGIPQVDKSSPEALLERTNWFHLLATVFAVATVAEGAGLVRSVVSRVAPPAAAPGP